MPLNMEVGLRPGHIVLDGDPAPPPAPKNGHSSTYFSAHLLWPNDRPSQQLLSTCSAFSLRHGDRRECRQRSWTVASLSH